MMDFFKGYGQILDCKLMNGFGFVEVNKTISLLFVIPM